MAVGTYSLAKPPPITRMVDPPLVAVAGSSACTIARALRGRRDDARRAPLEAESVRVCEQRGDALEIAQADRLPQHLLALGARAQLQLPSLRRAQNTRNSSRAVADAAPHRCMPAQADRVSMTTSVSFSLISFSHLFMLVLLCCIYIHFPKKENSRQKTKVILKQRLFLDLNKI